MEYLITYFVLGLFLSIAFHDKEGSISPILWIVAWPFMIIAEIIKRNV